MHVLDHAPEVLKARITKQTPQYQGTIRLEPASRKQKLIASGVSLAERFDEAMTRANLARERSGGSTPIKRRQEQGARCYYMPATHGGERTLVLFIVLPLRDGDLLGGAYIRPDSAWPAIYVIPAIEGESPRWLTQVSRRELTSAVIDDLFQATFCDDAAATRRLAPLYDGFDLFATPWS